LRAADHLGESLRADFFRRIEVTHDSRFLKACRREPTDCTPVWFMRQAGRYQAEYRALRRKHSMIELCKTPDLAAEVTLLPIRQSDLDAAIIFGDLMLPLEGMGVPFELKDNVGPIIEKPIRSEEDVGALRPLEPRRDVPYLLEALAIVRRELSGRVPLIGFAGAPFTLAAYMIEGRGSRDYRQTKLFMFSRADLWHRLMDHLAGSIALYLRAQVEAGADVVQLFDSWVGTLSPADYREYVLPHMVKLFGGLKGIGVPVIHFGTGTATLLPLMAEAGGDVIGADWRIPLDAAWDLIGHGRAIQGNLDPTVLLAEFDVVRRKASEVLEEVAGRPGHIFNLGHGILPGTPVDNVRRLADFVHEASARAAS
jgi:uroporphyrinogen decarboxylase